MLADLHTHILPGIDDGARNLEESLRLLEAEEKNGVGTVVFTPHFTAQHRKPREFFSQRQKALDTLLAGAPQWLDYRLGAEVLYTEYLANIEEIRDFCITGTDFLLLEMPYHAVFDDRLVNAVARLKDEHGIVPILAHVERYEAVRRNPEVLLRFREFGCLFQINASSALQKNCLIRLFLRRLVSIGCLDLLASDAHDSKDRTVEISRAREALSSRFGEGVLRRVDGMTNAVLTNEHQ